MSGLDEFVKESLPTTWSRRAGLATLSITSTSLFLPEFLQKINLHIEGTETLSFRIAVVSTILFLGSLVTLALVVRHFNSRPEPTKILPSTPQDRPLYPLQVKILSVLSKCPDGVVSEKLMGAIAAIENLSEDTAETLLLFHLRELENLRMVIVIDNKWSIIHEGTRYLVEHP